MSNTLRFNAGARTEGSRSGLAVRFVAGRLDDRSESRPVERELALEAIPHFDKDTIAASFFAADHASVATQVATKLVDRLIDESQAVDLPIIGFHLRLKEKP